MAAGILYNKPQISAEEQIAILKNDGLVFVNEGRAEHLLNHISFFRIKSYLHPFRKVGERSFKHGATFEQALAYISSIRNYENSFVRNWRRLRFLSELNYRITKLHILIPHSLFYPIQLRITVRSMYLALFCTF